jgi:hypothetical protein
MTIEQIQIGNIIAATVCSLFTVFGIVSLIIIKIRIKRMEKSGQLFR